MSLMKVNGSQSLCTPQIKETPTIHYDLSLV